ncbi:MAG: hypothetical protein ACI8QD_001898 [Cyclobacteriaceae bacterium]|jgi:hypothetical protein
MKKSIIQFLAKKNYSNKNSQISLSYLKASKIAILIDGEADWPDYDRLMEHLNTDDKSVSIMRFVKKTSAHLNYDEFCQNDLGLFGQIKSERLNMFLGQSYDYLLLVNRTTNPFIKYIASKTNHHTSIGLFHGDQNNYTDLQVKSEIGTELVNLIKYTRQLS